MWWTIPQAVVDRAAVGPRGLSPARSTRPSTRRSGCCRWSRRATGGTSAASRRRCTRTPGMTHDLHLRRLPGRRRHHRARVPHARIGGCAATLEAIRQCPCARGCPSCVQSPEVRQRQRAARQGGRRRAARRDPRRRVGLNRRAWSVHLRGRPNDLRRSPYCRTLACLGDPTGPPRGGASESLALPPEGRNRLP